MTSPKDRDNADEDNDAPVDKGTSAIEWIAAACGAILLAAMIGYMTYAGLHEVEGTPRVEFTTLPTVAQGDQFILGFTATNVGQATATSLTVRATLALGDQDVESQEVTIDYLPINSSRKGGFVFTSNPAGHRISIVATSYLDP